MDIIRRPVLTEKINALKDKRQYAFEVDPSANKITIEREIEKRFNVTVTSIRVQTVRGKKKSQLTKRGRFEGRTRSWKKVIVTLKEGQSIEYAENV
jgi:large subunit ribosomal protein L23